MIADYLTNISDFSSMIKSKTDDLDQLMLNISYVINYEKFVANSLIFRTGEFGSKFYLILQGKVVILLPKDEYHELTEVDRQKVASYRQFPFPNKTIIKS